VDEAPWGRFDDLVAGRGLLCPPPCRVLVAWQAAEVVPVLAEVERATQRGCWAFGYVGYEAASGLDPGLAVFDLPQDGPPLVWFGLREEPVAVPRIASPPAGGRDYAAERWQPGWTPCGYRRDVARVRDYIAAGDTYQCNLTVRLRSLVHPCRVGGFRWAADAPEVPPGHRPARLTLRRPA
jgi:para-aminobenzoate synthetase / 4-amino-4-deoxychorismate lyase